ncbi:hypothetical protein L6452_36143 [Arctium lappa]|uniref:Uncharacterized protein n=1 Tax=Arctium lappa TaxID=4217 RepID=A0ACB8Y936_ARCLA|nr:hypothetical protein L6452_36143 [Arctium lappa]
MQHQVQQVSTRSSKKQQPSGRNQDMGKDEAINVPSVVRIKVKEKYCRAQEENSDSDFETQRKKAGEGSCLRNKSGKKKNKEKIVKPPRKVVRIRTRTSSMILHQTIGELNDKQKKTMKEMGLECLIDLTSMETTDEGTELATIWKHQYKKESPRPNDVMKAIQSMSDAEKLISFLLSQLLYVESTIWANSENQTNDPPLCKWTMDELRKRQQCAIKGGGFQRALIRGPGQTSNVDHENTNTDPHSPIDSEEDEDAIKKGYIMDLNEKFELLMHTKVDVQNVIVKAKERFPSDTIFERYEDKLAILFNENAFRGSGKTKQHTTLERCKEARSSKQVVHEDNTIILCTPTKLNFEYMESLDALSPLSPYWYSQTTYGIIDAQIEEKSAGRGQQIKWVRDMIIEHPKL